MKNRIRPVKIMQVMNGFIVEVGCQTLVFQNKDTMLGELKEYMANPALVEKNYRESYGCGDEGIPMPEQCVNESNAQEVRRRTLG